jgi:syntaxin 6
MLGDLEQGVDETDNKLNASMLKMRKFIRQTEEKGSGWCIIILIIVLCMLLLAVILT